MIVVIGAVGAVGAEEVGSPVTPAGLAARVALAAAAVGATVEVVTRLGEDAAADAVLLAFAAAKVGHVATLRDVAHVTPIRPPTAEPIDLDGPDDVDAADDRGTARLDVTSAGTSQADPAAGPPTLDGADVGLALRYLADYRVIVVVHPTDDAIVREVVAATDWATAHLVVVTAPGASAPDGLPTAAVLLAAPDDAEAVAGLIGRYAAAVDGGGDPAVAFKATLGAAG